MKRHIGIIAALVVFSAAPAWALDQEYYTYGGYYAIVLAFQKIALILSDTGYQALFFSIIAAAIFLGATSTYFKGIMGAKVSALGWAPPILLGVGLYLAFVVPKGTLTVYDPLINRSQLIAGIPDGVVMVAGTLNKIEQGLVDIIDTSGNIEGYKRTAGGLGFNMIYQSTAGGFGLGNTYIGESLRRYVKDCVLFEMMRPGTTLTSESVTKTTTNLLSQFAEASNPAVWTVYYDSSNPTGLSTSCEDAYNNIDVYLNNDSNFEEVIKEACSSMGFNTENVLELQRCQENMQDFVSYLYKGTFSVSPQAFLRQIGMMTAMDDVLKSENPDMALKAMANRQTMTSGVSMGMVANEWLPVMRAVFTAVAIGLIPFICLFLPTGLVGKAASLIAGFFIWLSCWGITDAILHGIATDYALQSMDYIRANNLGYNAIMMYPSYMEKGLAMFGFVRTAGIMLATIMTSMLVRFGGTALAMMASNIQGTLQSSAGAAGMSAADPIGNMQARQQLMSTAMQQGSINAWDNMGKERFTNAAAMGELGFQKQWGGLQAQREHEKLTGMGREESLMGQSLKSMGTMQARKGQYLETTADGSKVTATSAYGDRTYDGGELVSAKGANISMSDMSKRREMLQQQYKESLDKTLSQMDSRGAAVQTLTNSGWRADHAEKYVDGMGGNVKWKRGRNEKDVQEQGSMQVDATTVNAGGNIGANMASGTGNTMNVGASAGAQRNMQVQGHKKEAEVNENTKAREIEAGKSLAKENTDLFNSYFAKSTVFAGMSQNMKTNGWSQGEGWSKSWSEVNMLETSLQKNTYADTIKSMRNDERFSGIQDMYDRDLAIQKYIETTYSANKSGGLKHGDVAGRINTGHAALKEYQASFGDPGGPGSPVRAPGSPGSPTGANLPTLDSIPKSQLPKGFGSAQKAYNDRMPAIQRGSGAPATDSTPRKVVKDTVITNR